MIIEPLQKIKLSDMFGVDIVKNGLIIKCISKKYDDMYKDDIFLTFDEFDKIANLVKAFKYESLDRRQNDV